MTDLNTELATLDWRDLAPEPEQHECDCGYCDMGGDLEPVQWPTLVAVAGDAGEYVTDRFMAIRADLAPIPDGYEGPVLSGGPKIPASWRVGVTDEPPVGLHFRWQITTALRLTGWRLRLLAKETTAWNERVHLVAVVTPDGEHIGWACAARERVEDTWESNATQEYVEEADRG